MGRVGLVIRPVAAALCALLVAATPNPAAAESDAVTLYVVVLEGPGTAGDPTLSVTALLNAQARTRAAVGASAPVYSWTTALNGYAARMTPPQAAVLAELDGVALVEPDRIQRLTSTPDVGAASAPLRPRRDGGRGVVVGVIDTGIAPDGPVFADSRELGPRPFAFTGSCPAAEGWALDSCTDKLVAARHYVAGFGEQNLRNGANLSPRDEVGHGTQVASLAVGNAEVDAREGNERLGRFGGIAPDARLSVYKACWQAPDPADDGCAASDLVAAINQATADGVDVLFLATQGSPGPDAVDLALLGAAEADALVVAAAGNGGTAGHAQPWVTTVGSTSGPVRAGRLLLTDGTSVAGVMTSKRRVDPARIVAGSRIPAPGASRADARRCLPGSLDAARAAGRIVVCLRGGGARIDKSRAVELADGVGMVLANGPGEAVTADFHSVPTLHVTAAAGRRLLRADGTTRATLRAMPVRPAPDRLAGWSPRGRLTGLSVEPDLVAPGTALLAATSPAASGRRWDLISGSSASAALVAGLAARLRAQHPDWSAALVRSALMTSATALPGQPALRQGAGLVDRDSRTRLGYDVAPGDFRRTMEGSLRTSELNLPSVIAAAPQTIERTITNIGPVALYWSSQSGGFRGYRVSVTPAAVRLAPGESATYTIRVTRRPGVRAVPESGWVAWLSARDTLTRIPVVVRPR